MANPYKDAEKVQKKNPPGGHPQPKEEVVVATTPVDANVPVVKEAPENPLVGLIEQKEITKSCSFTLTPDAIKRLDKAAKQLKCSRSKALDTLIKKYL